MAAPQRNTGKAFENEIEDTFEAYLKSGIARLAMMPVPMCPSGVRGRNNEPLYRPSGKAPFDVYGWTMRFGVMIGAELKRSERKPSLPIVMPKMENGKMVPGKGDGLQFHQLDCLNALATAGGVARLVWDNGGEVGVLVDDAISDVYSAAWESLQLEIRGSESARGTRSIRWERFTPCAHRSIGAGGVTLDWLRI